MLFRLDISSRVGNITNMRARGGMSVEGRDVFNISGMRAVKLPENEGISYLRDHLKAVLVVLVGIEGWVIRYFKLLYLSSIL